MHLLTLFRFILVLLMAFGYPALLGLYVYRFLPFRSAGMGFLAFWPSGILWAMAKGLAWHYPGMTMDLVQAAIPMAVPWVTLKLLFRTTHRCGKFANTQEGRLSG